MRRSSEALAEELRELAVAALADKVGSVTKSTSSPFDLEVEIDGQPLRVEVRTAAYATVERVEAMKRLHPPRGDGLVLVVADRINQPARAALKDAGWGYLDAASGALYLRGPGMRIDTTVDAVKTAPESKPVGVIGWSGRIAAYELLRRHFDRDPRPVLTSQSRDQFDLARSSTSDALRAMAAADLIDDGEPALPQLFWELAKVWAPTDRRWLASAPEADDWDVSWDPTRTTWRLGGVRAAVFHGAPAVGVGEGPIELYVPGPVLLSIATRRYGTADAASAAASVAVPSAHQVTRPWDSAHDHRHLGWPVVHPVAAALDLAALADARSQQILADWRPEGEAVWGEH